MGSAKLAWSLQIRPGLPVESSELPVFLGAANLG
jgi:hypothetical protein